MKAKLKEGWVPKWKLNEPENKKPSFPTFGPAFTNHDRNLARRRQREQAREMIREQRAKLAEATSKEV